MINRDEEPYTKDALRAVLRMKKGKFNAHMNILESELLALFPRYNKRGSILADNVFEWVCMDYGIEKGRMDQRLNAYYGIAKPANIEKIYGNAGITKA